MVRKNRIRYGPAMAPRRALCGKAMNGALLGLTLIVAAGCVRGNDENAPDPVVAAAESTPGAPYVNDENFRREVFDSALPVLVDFTATWCAPCKEVDPIVDELAAEMAGRAKVVKLDIDDSPEIYHQLNVNGVPTVMFFNGGREEDRLIGPQRREIYAKFLDTMIEGGDMLGTRLELLQQDEYRQHFILSRELEDIEAILAHRPGLLVEPFADGSTPLSAVLRRPSIRQQDLIQLILSQNPAIRLHDMMGVGRCDEFVAAVEADPDLANRPDADGATPLWLALVGSVRERDDRCARALLAAGAQPAGNSPFYLPRMVIFYEDTELLGALLERGMDPSETDEQGMNALHLAAMYGYYSIVDRLLAYGMDPAARNGEGETAAEMVRSQLERRAELRSERGMEESPEMQAAIRESTENSRRLLELLEAAQGEA